MMRIGCSLTSWIIGSVASGSDVRGADAAAGQTDQPSVHTPSMPVG